MTSSTGNSVYLFGYDAAGNFTQFIATETVPATSPLNSWQPRTGGPYSLDPDVATVRVNIAQSLSFTPSTPTYIDNLEVSENPTPSSF